MEKSVWMEYECENCGRIFCDLVLPHEHIENLDSPLCEDCGGGIEYEEIR